MNPYGTHFKNKHVMWIYGALVISALLPALLAVKNIKISPDSMIYSLMSQEILSGNGISLPIIYHMQDNYDFINGAVPFPAKPPLLPLLFALLGAVTPQDYLPAQGINVISHMAISFFTFLLINKLYDNKGIALLTGILVSLSFPILWNTHQMLSESLFIALTVAALYFLLSSRHTDNPTKRLIVASICASAAILTKYIGVALVPVFFWEALIIVKRKRKGSKYAFLATMIPAAATISLFICTYITLGTIQAWNPPSPDRSYLSAFTGTIKMIYFQFDLGERHAILITTLLTLFILYLILNTDARKKLSGHLHAGLDLIIFFILSHTLLITYAMATSQTVFEVRYMSPLVPFIFILGILIIVLIGEMVRSRGLFKLSLGFIILSLAIIAFGNSYKTYMRSGEFFHKRMGHYRILNSSTYNWIKENYGENVIITTNRPFHLSFFGGYSTIRLPHRRFNKNYRIPDNMESFVPNRMSKFGSQVLVLFEEADEQYEGSYIAGLFKKKTDDNNFVLAHKFSDGVVYNLKK